MIFRQATDSDFQSIWDIICFAKESRRLEGSNQWQDGYPNEQTIWKDIKNKNAFVLTQNQTIAMYSAILFEKEIAYENIQGQWLTKQDYSVVHRMAVAPDFKGKGLAKVMLRKAEEFTKQNQIKSLRIDTNFDNIPMLKTLQNMGYAYCGEVFFRGSPRKAFEKIIE